MALLCTPRSRPEFCLATKWVSILLLIGWVTALQAAESDAFVRWMNAGQAELENRNSAKAIDAFKAALETRSDSAAAWRNLSRAYMLADRLDDALDGLKRVRAQERESAATSYLTGLIYARRSQYAEAIPEFEAAVRLDPETAALRFQLANAYQLARQTEKALAQLRETVRLDPLHASAQFKLAMFARQAGDETEFQKRQQEFMRLRTIFGDESRTPTALERCRYTRPETAPDSVQRPGPGVPVRFIDATDGAFPDSSSREAEAACWIESDERGVPVLFTLGSDGRAGLLQMKEGKFARRSVAGSVPKTIGRIRQCLAGDFHDDVPKGVKYDPGVHALNDLLLVGNSGVCLLKRTGPDAFADVTAEAGLTGLRAERAQWLDYDHDGDLDLCLASDDGVHLWQNNGNGRFSDVTAQVGVEAAGAAVDVAAVDLDANVAMDILVAGGTSPTLVFMNQRAGRFARMVEPPGPWPPANRILVDDIDNDGNLDVVFVRPDHAAVWFGRGGKRQEIVTEASGISTAALFDYDNDGWLDFFEVESRADSSSGSRPRLWRNSGEDRWTEVSGPTGLGVIRLPGVLDVIAGDTDGDGDTDLLLVTGEGLRFLRNDGGDAQGQLKVRLVGMKTNPTGLGTRVEVRAGSFQAVRAVTGAGIEIGLGSRKRLDAVKTVWTNGIEDNQIDIVPPAGVLRIVEKNVAAGSCPFLYAWDGEHYRFITDLLGNAPLGLSARRGIVLPANPQEIVGVGREDLFGRREGMLDFVVTEEFREVLFLDQARLLAVDHAADVEVHPTDKLAPPPHSAPEVWALRSPRVLKRAVGDDGIDRTQALKELDGVFGAPGISLPPPLRGFCEPLALTLDFGLVEGEHAWVLALTGWLQYGDASVNIAASQNASQEVIPPTLEAETEAGVWEPVNVQVGMPAGKTKTILCDLSGKLPRKFRRLKLTTTFEIRWDRIALFERTAAPICREIEPAGAEIFWRGFSELKSRARGQPTTPDYGAVSERPAWRTTPEGWCTRYGDVLDLVRRRDDRLVILNAGDALRLRFDPAVLPAAPVGKIRTFFFYSAGWDKDADHNVVSGETVEPLPVIAGGDWILEYNTRWVPRNRFSPIGAGR